MALINITPIMTSDTTPLPYVSSASGIYSSAYPAYTAFNSIVDREGWCNQSQVQKGWVMLDFGSISRVSSFSISCGTHETIAVKSAPRDFSLEASIDGIHFDVLGIYENITNWEISETKMYDLGKIYSYRYYRINITASNGYHYSSIAELNFYINEDLQTNDNISHKNASLTYTIPMNTTQKILAKTNDVREGLLGMANDAENYGDLYVVGGDGKSHLTRSGIKSEVIFDGVAGSVGNYDLKKSINDYDFIIVNCSVSHEIKGENCYHVGNIIQKDSILLSDYNQFMFNPYSTNCMAYTFIDDYTFKITEKSALTLNWKDLKIISIIGIY